MEKLVSIIIVNYNNYKDTIDCLDSLRNQTYKKFEVLVVDNGSKYNLFLKLKKGLEQFQKKLNIRLIRSDVNLYFGAGNNKAIKVSKGDYVCLLNADTEVMPNFIESIVDFLEKNPEIGMVSPKIKLFSNKNYIWTTGGQVNFKTSAVVTNRGYLEFDPNNLKYNNIEPIDFSPGTTLFIRRKCLDEIGLIDEIYFMYWEDPDWNFRAQQLGYKSYYVPRTIVYHKIPIYRDYNSKRQVFNDFFFKRNKQIFVWKFASLKDLIIFYVKFYTEIFFEFIRKVKKKQIKILPLYITSLWKGFKIGIKRRTNRSCRKELVKDFYYVKKFQEG